MDQDLQMSQDLQTAHGPGPYGPHRGLIVTGERWTPNEDEKDSQPVRPKASLPYPTLPFPHSPHWI